MKDDQKEVLKAWIDGATIQWQLSDKSWSDCFEYGDCNKVYFNDDVIYRIKPKEIVTTTCIERDSANGLNLHSTYGGITLKHNLKLTWSSDGKTLIDAEVI